ncbi:MAG TPA: CDP-alcohol phosphatidyltransferase family protein [Actinoplanes sp.]
MRSLNRTPIAEIRERTYKSRDAWWTVLLVDPVAVHLVRWVAPYRWITPNRLSFLAALIGLGSAACFWLVTPWWLVAGAVLFHIAFVIDCMDGKVARLNGTGSVFGSWLDYMLDRIRVVTCTVTLVGGQWRATGEDYWLILGGVIVFLEMFHNLNSREVARTKGKMRNQLSSLHRRMAVAEGRDPGMKPRFVEEVMKEVPGGQATDADLEGVNRTVVDLNEDFRSRFSAFVRFRNALRRSRIRPNLVSTIEFAMGVFIVAPIAGAIGGRGWLVGVILATSALVLMFDLAIIYKLYLSTKGFERERAKLLVQVEEAEAKAEAEAAAEAGVPGPDGAIGTDPATQPPNALRPVSR